MQIWDWGASRVVANYPEAAHSFIYVRLSQNVLILVKHISLKQVLIKLHAGYAQDANRSTCLIM